MPALVENPAEAVASVYDCQHVQAGAAQGDGEPRPGLAGCRSSTRDLVA
jgi:hypothetical protein